jgi:phenylpropionate dioxygenase-like ring-hydroxylating dioxygenase large terminal subunit
MKAKTDTSTLLKRLATLAALPQDTATAMPPEMYHSSKVAKREQRHIFKQEWLCAGLSNAIPKTGDYLSYELGDQPVVVIRQKDGSVLAFANVCRHRMMSLVTGSGSCKNKRIMCPYHAWSYDIDGSLKSAPQMQYRADFNKQNYGLIPVRCEVWEGWIYVTLNPDAPSVAGQLGELKTVVTDYQMENYVPIVQQDHVWNTNWKMLTENFMEGYHLPVTHRGTVGGHFPVEETEFSALPANPAFTYQLYTKKETAPVGNAHPDNKVLKGKQRRTSVLPTIFPSHMISLAPDHLWYLSLQPLGHDKVSIRYGAALAPEVLAASEDPDNLINGVIQFLDQVNEEDREVVEGIFKGSNGPLSNAGPLCWLERENHEFTQYIARRLCE